MYTKKYFKWEFNFEFSTEEEYIKSLSFLNNHINQAVTISGTHQYHAFILSDENTSEMYVKLFHKARSSNKIFTLTAIKRCIRLCYNSVWSKLVVKVHYRKKWSKW